jgi:hypothetical protein
VVVTLDWLLAQRFAGGNLPSSLGSDRDRLVHWCHGASGAAMVFAAAFTRTGERRFLDAAARFADVVWRRGLLRKLSICHGVAAGVYSQLAVWRAARGPGGDVALATTSLRRARLFAAFMLWGPTGKPPATGTAAGAVDVTVEGAAYWEWLVADGHIHGGDAPLSLFEGAAGVAAAMLDVAHCGVADGSAMAADVGRGHAMCGLPGFEAGL